MKINKAYLEQRGFKKTVDDVIEEETGGFCDKIVKKIVVYEIYSGNKNTKKHARYDHTIIAYYKKGKVTCRSNFYSFYCVGNGFKISDKLNISHRNYDVEQIDIALNLVGIIPK